MIAPAVDGTEVLPILLSAIALVVSVATFMITKTRERRRLSLDLLLKLTDANHRMLEHLGSENWNLLLIADWARRPADPKLREFGLFLDYCELVAAAKEAELLDNAFLLKADNSRAWDYPFFSHISAQMNSQRGVTEAGIIYVRFARWHFDHRPAAEQMQIRQSFDSRLESARFIAGAMIADGQDTPFPVILDD